MLGLIILSSALLAPNRLFARLQTQPFGRALNAQWYGLLGLEKDTRLLEVGCGPGRLASTLTTYGHTVIAVDRSWRMVRAARRFAGDRLEVLQADATQLPLADASVDAVMAASLLNVLPDPVAALREFGRVARPGAVITALMPSPDFSADRARGIVRDYGLGYLDQAMLETWARVARKTAPEQALTWFVAAGLPDCRIQPLMAGTFLAAVARVGP